MENGEGRRSSTADVEAVEEKLFMVDKRVSRGRSWNEG